MKAHEIYEKETGNRAFNNSNMMTLGFRCWLESRAEVLEEVTEIIDQMRQQMNEHVSFDIQYYFRLCKLVGVE